MNQKEVVDTLLEQAKIEPGFTELVWQKLEEENREFFKAYYLRLMVKHQIMEYNELLEQQINHMRQMHPTAGASVRNRNGSHVPPMNQQQLLYERKEPDQSSPNLSSPYLNGGSAINTNIPSYVDFSSHSRRVDPSPNSLSLQATNMPLMQGMIKSETAYQNCAPYMYGGEAQSTVGDVTIASFSNDSSNQSLNDPLVDPDAPTFGSLGQIPQNFSLSDLTADFSQSSDILESYEGSPFLLADAENFLDSSERVEHQGDHERLRTISSGFSYENFRSN
ncbi:histidine-tRNA ligase [Arabidopsis thaliana]|nr:histidine-tRNA ligase [Arabidopsis thaliana]NP_001331481.1 histidine-tRNA ligase [Arabidopsis thaliana]ANM69828.1 histidine-tRNA ligase [Arabidopsis thaliana]ANM69831.1 histidine-tRNA ligase [Arabidopsis thaliana]|eukprot:NP_001331478.1 histidine-tRNA ligase [Arabidopsis thaliana]